MPARLPLHTSQALRAWQSSDMIQHVATDFADDRGMAGGMLAKEAPLNTAVFAKGAEAIHILEAAALDVFDRSSRGWEHVRLANVRSCNGDHPAQHCWPDGPIMEKFD